MEVGHSPFDPLTKTSTKKLSCHYLRTNTQFLEGFLQTLNTVY